jgi:hypothetical protein
MRKVLHFIVIVLDVLLALPTIPCMWAACWLNGLKVPPFERWRRNRGGDTRALDFCIWLLIGIGVLTHSTGIRL